MVTREGVLWTAVFVSFFIGIVGLPVLLTSNPLDTSNPQTITGMALLTVGGACFIVFGLILALHH